MGQRLVITIADDHNNPTQKCCIYYHWSSYFAPAIYETTKVCLAILEAEKSNSDVLLTVERMLEEKNGGIRGTDIDIEYAQKLYPGCEFKKGDRNEGIMTFTEEGIESYMSWAEGSVYIDLKTREIDFNCFGDPEPFSIGSNVIQDLGDAGYIVGTLKTGSGYVRYGEYVCPIDIYHDLTIDNIKEVYDFMNFEKE